ncbi:MAG: hypothetical protein WA687_07005 [Solirubrobacterales bacterium]
MPWTTIRPSGVAGLEPSVSSRAVASARAVAQLECVRIRLLEVTVVSFP